MHATKVIAILKQRGVTLKVATGDLKINSADKLTAAQKQYSGHTDPPFCGCWSHPTPSPHRLKRTIVKVAAA